MHKFFQPGLLLWLCISLAGGASVWAASSSQETLQSVLVSYSQEKLPEFSRADIGVKILDDFGKLGEWTEDRYQFQVGRTLANFRPVGTVVFPIDVYRDRDRVDTFFVKADVQVMQDVLVARRRISKGEKITSHDVQQVKKNVALLPLRFFSEQAQVTGKEARMTIPEDRVLLTWMVRNEPMVHQRTNVTLVAHTGNVRVEAKATALEDGQMGEKIRVTNSGSAKIFQARVIGPSLLEVLP